MASPYNLFVRVLLILPAILILAGVACMGQDQAKPVSFSPITTVYVTEWQWIAADEAVNLANFRKAGWQTGSLETLSGKPRWVTFAISHQQPEGQSFYLDPDRWGLVHAVVTEPTGNVISEHRTGGEIPFAQRDVPYFKPMLSIFLPEPGTYQVYLSLQGQRSYFRPDTNTFSLIPKAVFEQEQKQRLFSQALFMGVIMVMALYNFLIFLSVKDISFWWYVLSIVGVGVYFAFFYGFLLEYIWPWAPNFDVHSFALVLPLTGIARLYFTKSYLNTPQLLPGWNKVLNLLAWLYVLPVVLAIVSWLGWADLLGLLVQWIGWMGTAVLSAMLLAGLAGYLKGYRPALFFVSANALFIVGAILFIFREINWLPDHFFTRYVVQIGVLAQVVLFSLGLAYRLNRAQRDLAEEKLNTERLALEKEQEKNELVLKQKIELEQEVARQTADLRQKTLDLETAFGRLTESENHLRELNQVKTQLFTIISHDLRSPLVTLHAFLGLLSQHAGRLTLHEFKSLSAKTQQALSNLSFLLDNLLNWSRTQMEQVVRSPEAIDIQEVIGKNLELFSFPVEHKQLRVTVTHQGNTTIFADRMMVDTVVRNLLNNAIKFTPDHGEIKLSTWPHEGRELCLAIRDSGEGFGEGLLNDLARGAKPVSTKGTQGEKGTGLGLLICREFVAANQGTLQLDNHPEGGAWVKVWLPLE